MEAVIRGLVVYLFLLVLLRLIGKRTLGQVTTFDFVLLLIISETVQNALVGKDYSLTNAILLVVTLVTIDLGLSLWKQRSPFMDRLIDGVPLVLMRDGRFMRQDMERERVDEAEVLSTAREKQGLAGIGEIQHAVLERSGEISIIPRRE
jgi:uncharacterized membrane protein YcaP (DUF421 family)